MDPREEADHFEALELVIRLSDKGDFPRPDEVLAGARDRRHLLELERLLAGCEMLSVRQPDDFETAAAIHRAARAQGRTIASSDCLIAAVAIREEVLLLYRGSDFETIAAAVTDLEADT